MGTRGAGERGWDAASQRVTGSRPEPSAPGPYLSAVSRRRRQTQVPREAADAHEGPTLQIPAARGRPASLRCAEEACRCAEEACSGDLAAARRPAPAPLVNVASRKPPRPEPQPCPHDCAACTLTRAPQRTVGEGPVPVAVAPPRLWPVRAWVTRSHSWSTWVSPTRGLRCRSWRIPFVK